MDQLMFHSMKVSANNYV